MFSMKSVYIWNWVYVLLSNVTGIQTLNSHLLQFEISTNKTVVIQFRAHNAFLK